MASTLLLPDVSMLVMNGVTFLEAYPCLTQAQQDITCGTDYAISKRTPNQTLGVVIASGPHGFYPVDSVPPYILWLYELPTWLLAVLLMRATLLLSLGGLRMVHRRLHVSKAVALIDNGTVGWFSSGVTVLYGLMLGLLTVAT